MASNQQEHHAASNVGKKVRVVAKVRGFSHLEPDFPAGSSRTVDWISVSKPQGENSEGVSISFGEQSSSQYLVDYFYEQHEESELIYSREVKPLISAVFEGHNSSIIACGARGSGKTHLLQGSAERPGLVVHAVAEFLSMAEKNGNSTAISFYEVDHLEHAVDLLNPGKTPILVFEDRGKIQYKGLSQIPVKSIDEFQNLYLTACSTQKAVQKKGFDQPRRTHRGLIVHVFSQNGSTETCLVSKMTFVDLAGYEDARKISSDGTCLAEANKIHKSIHALLNVSHALSTNESRVPYRESKLTRMLQDSLRGTSKILMVACLNPSLCQDTAYMLSLASRSCQSVQQTPLDSTKKSASSVRAMVPDYINLKSVSTTAKKIHGPRSYQSEKKAVVPMKSANKERKLFDEASVSSVTQIVTSHKSQIPKSVSTTAKKIHGPRSYQSEKKAVVPMKSANKARKIFDEASVSSVRQIVTSHKSQIPKSVSTTAKKIHGPRSYQSEKKTAVPVKSAIKGRKLFHEASHSASKAEKEISMPQTSSEAPLDNSQEIAGNHAELNPRVEKDNSFTDGSHNEKLNLMEENGISVNGEDHEEASSCEEVVKVEEGHHLNKENSLMAKEQGEQAAAIVLEGHDMDKENNSLMANEQGEQAAAIVPEGHNMNKENNNLMENEVGSPPISSQLRDLSNRLKLLLSVPLPVEMPEKEFVSVDGQMSTDVVEPKTPVIEQTKSLNDNKIDVMNAKSPWQTLSMRGSGMKDSLVQEYLRFLNTANKEELKKLKGIGEIRATTILELRDESPEPFKSLDDLKDIGLSAKQIKGIMKKEVGELLFN